MSSESKGATGLAGRYATALFELAEAGAGLDTVASDLARLEAMIRESADLRRLIASPVLRREDQRRAMAAVMEKAGLSPLTIRFVGVVARNRRLFALPGMIAAFHRMMAAHRGEAAAEVLSAKELTPAQMDALGRALKQAAGVPVAIDAKVEPGLLGGLIVKMGSRMVDSSLRTKLQQLRLAMKGIG